MTIADDAYCRYYVQQCGGALPHYSGAAHQKGHGLGSMLRGTFRRVVGTLLPVAKTFGKRIAKNVAMDVLLGGENIGSSLKRRALEEGKAVSHHLVDTAATAISRRGIKRRAQSGSGRPRKVRKQSTHRGRPRKTKAKPKKRGRSSTRERKTRDIFD